MEAGDLEWSDMPVLPRQMPEAGVRKSPIVEIHRVLGGEHHPNPERAPMCGEARPQLYNTSGILLLYGDAHRRSVPNFSDGALVDDFTPHCGSRSAADANNWV